MEDCGLPVHVSASARRLGRIGPVGLFAARVLRLGNLRDVSDLRQVAGIVREILLLTYPLDSCCAARHTARGDFGPWWCSLEADICLARLDQDPKFDALGNGRSPSAALCPVRTPYNPDASSLAGTAPQADDDRCRAGFRGPARCLSCPLGPSIPVVCRRCLRRAHSRGPYVVAPVRWLQQCRTLSNDVRDLETRRGLRGARGARYRAFGGLVRLFSILNLRRAPVDASVRIVDRKSVV